jgi:hypothetical protein
MFRLLKIGALVLLLSVVAAIPASAATIIDPIVRTRQGGTSIPVVQPLPFRFDFGLFPDLPDADNCFLGSDPAGVMVSCAFQNQTGESLTFLDFDFGLPGPPGALFFSAEDLGGFFQFTTANSAGALLLAGSFAGIPPAFCDPEFGCSGGEFIVDLIGFPEETRITMVANDTPIPEPMTLTLLATGLGLGVVARRRRK